MKILKTLIHSLLVIVVVLAGSFLSGTHAYAVEANQGVAMQVKVRLKLQDGTIINNPPTDIRISWNSNPEDPEGDGCNTNGGLLFAASNPSQGQPVPQYNGASWMLYREGGTREAAVWAQTEDNNGDLTNTWDWIGRGGASVGPCTCVHRRATVTLNGESQTKEFVQRGTGITGGPFNNGATTIAEFDFNAPPPPGVTPTITPATSNPQLGDLFFNAGAGGKEVGVSSQFETVSTTPDPDQRNAQPRRYALSGKRASFGGGNFYNPLLITQKLTEPENVDYAGVAFGHAGNSGGFGGTEPFPTSGSNLNAFDKLKRFVAVPSTKNSDGSTPGPGYILLYAYNTFDSSTDELFTSRPNPPFAAGNYYIYLPEGLNSNSDFGQWYEIQDNEGRGVNIPSLPNGNNPPISCTTEAPNPTCYLTARRINESRPGDGSLQWELEIFPAMGSSVFTEVSFLKPKGQNKTVYKQQPQTP